MGVWSIRYSELRGNILHHNNYFIRLIAGLYFMGNKRVEYDRITIPAGRNYDLPALRRQCLEYKASHLWYPRALMFDGEEGKQIKRQLENLSRSTFKDNNSAHIRQIAEYLGVPFEPHWNLEDAKEKLFADFERIHKDGYLSPVEVRRENSAVSSRAVHLFGSYAAAMRAWKPGAYESSVQRHSRHTFDIDGLLADVRSALLKVFRAHDYIGQWELRRRFPDVASAVETVLKLKCRTRSYLGFVEKYLPRRYRPLSVAERAQVGQAGELFSFASLFLKMQSGENLALFPSFPKRVYKDHQLQKNLDARIQLYTPHNPRSMSGMSFPDIGVLNLNSQDATVQLQEVKAGTYYPNAFAEGLVYKYSSSPDDPVRLWNREDATPVCFDAVHLHVRPQCIEGGVRGIFKEAGVRVLDSAGFLDEFSGHPELRRHYELFYSRPFQYVRAKASRLLEAMVLELAPAKTREEFALGSWADR